jgi:beta-galactosidase
VEVFNEAYRLKEKGAILNWFDIEAPEGYLNLNDKMSVIMDTLQGKMLLGGLFLKLMPKKKGGDSNQVMGGMEMTGDMMAMLGGFTILRLLNMAGGMLGIEMSKEELLALNAKLNKIKRPKNK